MGMCSDELIERLKSGERKAIEELYDQYSSTFYGMITRIVKDGNVADAILEKAFIRILDEIHTIDSAAGVFTWMCSIVRSISIKMRSTKQTDERYRGTVDTNLTSNELSNLQRLRSLSLIDQQLFMFVSIRCNFTQDACSYFDMPVTEVRARLRVVQVHLRTIDSGSK